MAIIIGGAFAFGLAKLPDFSFEYVSNVPESNEQSTLIKNEEKISDTQKTNVEKPEDSVPFDYYSQAKDENYRSDDRTDTDLSEDTILKITGSGTVWEGAPHLSEHASLEMTIKPIPNTEFEKFEIISGKLIIDNYALDMNSGTAIINDDQMVIDSKSGNQIEPDLKLTANISGDILENKKIGVIFSDQLLYMTEGDMIPYHLELNGIMEY